MRVELRTPEVSARGWRFSLRLMLVFAASLAVVGGVPAGEPMVLLSDNEIKFETQAQGTTSIPRKILLKNIGTAELIINAIAISGENGNEFAETHTCPTAPASLAAEAVCEIQIVFKPKTEGDLSAALSISDNASGSPHNVSLKGHSSLPVPAVALSPVVLAFGNQPIGTSGKLQVIVLSNLGSATLTLTSGIRIDGAAGAEFRLQKTNSPCPEGAGQLAPSASCSIGIVFIPASAGPKSAQVIVVDDAAGSPQTVALSGVGSGT